MKKILHSTLALTAIFWVAPVLEAHADTTPGWYVGGGVGAVFTPDETAKRSTDDTKVTFDPGWSVLGNGGYAWNNGLRLEGEVWHSRANVDKVMGPDGSNGHLSNTDLFGNIFYDFHTGMMLTPYVGAGVGADISADADHIGTLNGGGGALNDGQIEFAYQAIAGVAAQLDYNWAVSADYRYIASLDPTYKATLGGSAKMENASHNIILSVRYSFGEPEPLPPVQTTMPPQPRPVQAAKPVVQPVPQSYMVFFDFDKSDLTPEAKRILASATLDFQKGGFVRIVVTGHTDTVGTVKYNQKLSDRRAAAVKAELAKLGVMADVIKAVGVGKNGLLVPTADGVREAQNRRAEIVFNK